MLSSVFTTRNNSPPQWFYDPKRNHLLFAEDDTEKTRRAERQAKARKEKKELELLTRKRRSKERLQEQRLQEKRDADRRVIELEGRIKQLASKAIADKSDTKSRSELSYARTQLYWIKNVPSP